MIIPGPSNLTESFRILDLIVALSTINLLCPKKQMNKDICFSKNTWGNPQSKLKTNSFFFHFLCVNYHLSIWIYRRPLRICQRLFISVVWRVPYIYDAAPAKWPKVDYFFINVVLRCSLKIIRSRLFVNAVLKKCVPYCTRSLMRFGQNDPGMSNLFVSSVLTS